MYIHDDGGGALEWTGRETEPIINIIIGRPWGTAAAALTLARIAGVEFLTRNYGCIILYKYIILRRAYSFSRNSRRRRE